MRCVIQMHQCLTGHLREQARSHMGLVRGGDFGPDRIPFVGVSLLANAVCHPDSSVPERTSSRASSLPHGALAVAEISVQTEFHLWERACSRMRCVIQMHQCLTGPLREQARSHMGIGRGGDFCPDRIPFVGVSLLAKASVHSTHHCQIISQPPPSALYKAMLACKRDRRSCTLRSCAAYSVRWVCRTVSRSSAPAW